MGGTLVDVVTILSVVGSEEGDAAFVSARRLQIVAVT